MSNMDGINLGIALLGAFLGIINFIIERMRDRFRLRVRLKFSYMSDHAGNVEKNPGLAIEVVNLNQYPVTISEVGFRGRS